MSRSRRFGLFLWLLRTSRTHVIVVQVLVTLQSRPAIAFALQLCWQHRQRGAQQDHRMPTSFQQLCSSTSKLVLDIARRNEAATTISTPNLLRHTSIAAEHLLRQHTVVVTLISAGVLSKSTSMQQPQAATVRLCLMASFARLCDLTQTDLLACLHAHTPAFVHFIRFGCMICSWQQAPLTTGTILQTCTINDQAS